MAIILSVTLATFSMRTAPFLTMSKSYPDAAVGGPSVGCKVGKSVGSEVGCAEGAAEGSEVGNAVGAAEGSEVCGSRD